MNRLRTWVAVGCVGISGLVSIAGSQIVERAAAEPIADAANTAGEANALRAAHDYLSTQAFSRRGLIKQLHSSYGDGYSKHDAVYAVNSCGANWFKQAYKAAKEYLSTESFSKSGLIQQLESPYGSDFTHAQAIYGANKAYH